MTTPIDTVRGWQLAASIGYLDQALTLSCEDIEGGGPNGSGRSHQLARDWIARTGIELEELRRFRRGDVVVVEQRAGWKLPDGSKSTKTIGTVSEVVGARVARVIGYDSLGETLAAVGLSEGDEAR